MIVTHLEQVRLTAVHQLRFDAREILAASTFPSREGGLPKSLDVTVMPGIESCFTYITRTGQEASESCDH